jgi:beta-phosphoglucomutase
VTLEAVIFDFDGVLANSEPLHLRVYQSLLAEENVSLSSREYYDRYLGLDDVGVFEALARDKGLDAAGPRMAALIDRKTKLFQQLAASVDVLFPGAAACLRDAAAAVPVAIASGALRHEIEMILGAAGLLATVPVIVASGDTPRSKPAPDPYALAVERLSRRAGATITPSRAVAIEDSRAGLRSARDAGLRTLGATTSYPADQLPEAERTIRDISVVTLALLDELTRSAPPSRVEALR